MDSHGGADLYKELSCPVCNKIYKSPVFLSCSHSFCKECIEQSWRTTVTRECPVCRRRASKEFYPPNLVLGNLCEFFLKKRFFPPSESEEELCIAHKEKLKLFCMEDKQPVCLLCRDSQEHTNHTFRPISEIGPPYKGDPESLKEQFKHKGNMKGKHEKTGQHTKKNKDLIKRSTLTKNGNPALYRLQKKTVNLDQSKPYRKMTFGQRDEKKAHKTILMVGETGTGKTTLINVMINYMLDVQREDKVWFEITDDQSDRSSVHSQTSIITVYGFYLQESPIHLTIIDTPGYGDTRGVEKDEAIAMSLLSLSESAEGIDRIHAVCLVIMAQQNRLSGRQIYIYDAVQSLFGRDTAENIVLLFTHSDGAKPKNALMAVKEAEIKSAVNDKNQPVYFRFNNRQSDAADEEDDEDEEDHKQRLDLAWKLSFKGMEGLFKFLQTLQPKSLKMTRDVLQKRKQLEANLNNLESRVHMMELKQNELKKTQESLEQNKNDVKNNMNFEYEVEVPYKEKVDIDPDAANMATCCTVCEENCHYPGCWRITPLSLCSVMRNNHCTVCTNKCHFSKHVKEAKIYVTKTKKEKRTYEDLKKKYDDIIGDSVSLVKKLEEELQELEKEKVKLVIEAFHCVDSLQMIALNPDSLIILQHIDYLIEKLKEINEPEKAKTLENTKKRAEEEKKWSSGTHKKKF